jgi:hypothetical protein
LLLPLHTQESPPLYVGSVTLMNILETEASEEFDALGELDGPEPGRF